MTLTVVVQGTHCDFFGDPHEEEFLIFSGEISYPREGEILDLDTLMYDDQGNLRVQVHSGDTSWNIVRVFCIEDLFIYCVYGD